MAQSEASMEKALITQLTQDISQWTYRKDIVDEDSLWANFRKKLNQNNQAALDGVPITDVEFGQIQQYIGTDYEAYSKTHEGVSKLKYNRRAKEAVVELVQKIRPLRDK